MRKVLGLFVLPLVLISCETLAPQKMAEPAFVEPGANGHVPGRRSRPYLVFSRNPASESRSNSVGPTKLSDAVYAADGMKPETYTRLEEYIAKELRIKRSKARAKIGSKSTAKSLGRCTMYTAIVLGRLGAIPGGGLGSRLSASAKDTGRKLASAGYKNLGVMEPGRAKPGDVIVYAPHNEGRHCFNSASKRRNFKHGHIEIRLKDGYASDYLSSNPRTGGGIYGRCRKVSGVYRKVI